MGSGCDASHPEGFSQGCKARGILLQQCPQQISLLPWHCIPSSACPVMLPRLDFGQCAQLPQQGLISLLLCCSLRGSSDPFCLLTSTLDAVVP